MGMTDPRRPGRGDQSASSDSQARYHPVRAAILLLLARDGGRALSAADLRAELSESTATVKYHLRVLRRLQLIYAGGEDQLYRLA